MPEHVHLLISEPERANPSIVMQVLKQGVAKRLLRKPRKRNAAQTELWRNPAGEDRFWQRRFYDFNVFSEAKRIEKLQYMHHNPVKRGLVNRAELWAWSSYRVHAFGEHGRVKMDWLFRPYVFRKPKTTSGTTTGMGKAHPAKTAQTGVPSNSMLLLGWRVRHPH